MRVYLMNIFYARVSDEYILCACIWWIYSVCVYLMNISYVRVSDEYILCACIWQQGMPMQDLIGEDIYPTSPVQQHSRERRFTVYKPARKKASEDSEERWWCYILVEKMLTLHLFVLNSNFKHQTQLKKHKICLKEMEKIWKKKTLKLAYN